MRETATWKPPFVWARHLLEEESGPVSPENYPKKVASAIECRAETPREGGAELSFRGAKRSAAIQPSPSPANRKVTAVGRSYFGYLLVSVSIADLLCHGLASVWRTTTAYQDVADGLLSNFAI
jgi:hypothetical protein